ncbi:Gfo/Idh/MocA family protein [Gryllotalpicola ginsengisoli]|uniref:Gfo/Idh/MocA family protein n=1 Tax=Gryllotalpicola ginsengisoli TaxID=444608 RepID=UPI0003B3ED25|nr:Gfo/Idh/MocA family oxidoreductase [Gryllotalpicola ginsengisoli]
MTLPEPGFPDPADAPSLRWGVLAPGGIARSFVSALQEHSSQRVVAVASRSHDRARAFADQFGIERAHQTYAALVGDPDVDVVYVASTHNAHLELALLAIEAGKHVLVEKPAAFTADQAQRMHDAARDAHVFLMEAMWTRYLPHIDVARRLISSGALGDIRLVTADFGVKADYDPASRMFDPDKAGGALLDLGVYPISFAQFALPALTHDPKIHVAGSLAPTGTDAQVSLLLEADASSHALLHVGVEARTPWTATISGTEGRIEIDAPFWSPSALTFIPADGETERYPGHPAISGGGGMAFEAAALARYVSDGLDDSPLHPFSEAIATLRIIDEARRRLGYTAALGE